MGFDLKKIEGRLILTGFMGSGKSSVGRILAESIGCSFVDLDADIVATEGRSINDIFASDGEQVFRKMESRQLNKVLADSCVSVIATGGGAVISEDNRRLMRSCGTVVNLRVTIEQVLSRLAGSNDRPLLAENAAKCAEILLKEREIFYADADIRIDTDGKSVEDVVKQILSFVKGV